MTRIFPSLLNFTLVALVSSVAVAYQFRIETTRRLSPAQIDAIVKATRKLLVTVSLDRAVYFPGEEADISVTVQNPTPDVLEVLEPFVPGTGGLNMLVRDPSRLKSWGTEWMFLTPHPIGMGELPSDMPTRYMQPIEKLQLNFTYSEGCLGKIPIAGGCKIPEREGEYQRRVDAKLISQIGCNGVVPFW